MANISVFIGKVQEDVFGVTRPLLLDAIREALIKFCEESLIYKETQTFTIVSGQHEYSLVPPTGMVVEKVNRLLDMTNAYDLIPVIKEEIPYAYISEAGPPRSYYLTPYHSVYIVENPRDNEAGILVQGDVCFKPSRLIQDLESFEVPDFFYEYWADGIAAYAKYYLQKMINKGWSNFQLAQTNFDLYKREVSRAKVQTLRSHTNVGRSMQPQRFGG